MKNYHHSSISLMLIIIMSVCSLLPTAVAKPPFTLKKHKYYVIENQDITESSGLGCSTRDSNLLWTHNDSGHMPIIYALDTQGRDRGTFHLDSIESRDWEDMDAFQWNGKHYLLIADTGDNKQLFYHYQISIFPEPDLNARPDSLEPAWTVSYQYEDGESYDVEAVAVNVAQQKIFMLTKNTRHALMFELPLKPEQPGLQSAKKLGEFKRIKQPSGLVISPDGRFMAINTYRRVHQYKWQTEKGKWQYFDTLAYKKLYQPESLCLSLDNKHYFVTSEKKSKLVKIRANKAFFKE